MAKRVAEVVRKPIGFATYRGYVDMPLEPCGPNYMGELMWPVTLEYDSAKDRTRVGFSLIPPPKESS